MPCRNSEQPLLSGQQIALHHRCYP